MINITKLYEKDWQSWKNIRLEALKNAPEAFVSSFDEEFNLSEDTFKQILISNTIFCAMYDREYAGVIGFHPMKTLKINHKGMLWGLYVRSQYRNRGIADRLVESVIACARKQVKQLYLTVNTTNTAAIALYQKHGFTIYGTDVGALKVGDHFYDEYLMRVSIDT